MLLHLPGARIREDLTKVAAALVTLLILSWAGLAAVTSLGYAGDLGWLEPAHHIRLAIPAFLLGTLAHAMTMFYFIGTGKVVREEAASASLGPDWVAETRSYKRQVFPWATWTLMLIVAVPILGGAVDTGWLPGWVHGVLALAMLAAGARAVVLEVSCISRNLRLLDRLEAALPPAPERAG
ncbi:MAG: hypothetical protein ACE5HD_00520 [Acidobacteriota bacterium]